MSNTVILSCDSCGTSNRVDENKIQDKPKCGKCSAPLNLNAEAVKEVKVLDRPVHGTNKSFETEVIKYPGLVLVDFWAQWCGPCRMIGPVLEKLSSERAGKLKVVKINTEEERELASRFGIRSIPTLILFKNGKIINQISGALPKPQLEAWIDSSSLKTA